MSDHNEQLANQPKFLRQQAIKALKKAKELEAAQKKNGAKYIHVPHLRCSVLVKSKTEGNNEHN